MLLNTIVARARPVGVCVAAESVTVRVFGTEEDSIEYLIQSSPLIVPPLGLLNSGVHRGGGAIGPWPPPFGLRNFARSLLFQETIGNFHFIISAVIIHTEL